MLISENYLDGFFYLGVIMKWTLAGVLVLLIAAGDYLIKYLINTITNTVINSNNSKIAAIISNAYWIGPEDKK